MSPSKIHPFGATVDIAHTKGHLTLIEGRP
jgi:hypothetical protein